VPTTSIHSLTKYATTSYKTSSLFGVCVKLRVRKCRKSLKPFFLNHVFGDRPLQFQTARVQALHVTFLTYLRTFLHMSRTGNWRARWRRHSRRSSRAWDLSTISGHTPRISGTGVVLSRIVLTIFITLWHIGTHPRGNTARILDRLLTRCLILGNCNNNSRLIIIA